MPKKFNIKLGVTSLLLAVFLLSCGQTNILESTTKESDEKLLVDAQKLMDSSSWDSALTVFDSMSAEFLARRDVKIVRASAYAGKCGFDFLGFVEGLQNIGVTNLLSFLFQLYPASVDANITACTSAESIMKSISTDANLRTVNENTLMAFLGFAKVGVVLNRYADTNLDNLVDGTFDSCSAVSIPDASVKEVGTGLAIALSSLQAPGVTLAGTQLTSLTSVCSQIETQLGAAYNFCADTDTADITADEVKGIRTLIGVDESIGLASCSVGSKTFGDCPCP